MEVNSIQNRFKLFREEDGRLFSIPYYHQYFKQIPYQSIHYALEKTDNLVVVKYIEDDNFDGELRVFKKLKINNQLYKAINKYTVNKMSKRDYTDLFYPYENSVLKGIFKTRRRTLAESIFTISLIDKLEIKDKQYKIHHIGKVTNIDGLEKMSITLDGQVLECDLTKKDLIKWTKIYVV